MHGQYTTCALASQYTPLGHIICTYICMHGRYTPSEHLHVHGHLCLVNILHQSTRASPSGYLRLSKYLCGILGKKSLRELRQLYFRMKDEVFGRGRFGMAYNTDKLEEILKQEFGDIKMSDVQYPR